MATKANELNYKKAKARDKLARRKRKENKRLKISNIRELLLKNKENGLAGTNIFGWDLTDKGDLVRV